MNTSLPSAADVRASLQTLSLAELKALAARSGVPYTTLWKIRAGGTEQQGTDNPRLDTVREFWPHIGSAVA